MLTPRRLGFGFLLAAAVLLPFVSLGGTSGGAALGGGVFCLLFGLFLPTCGSFR